MAFLDIYPSYSKLYGIPNRDSDPLSHDFKIKYGVDKEKNYFLFKREYTSHKRYSVSTHLYRHIYALDKLYVLDMNTLVNGRMFYVEYEKGTGFKYIYFTPKYGWVTLKKNDFFLGYFPREYNDIDTGKINGDEFYVISGIDNTKELTEVSEITLTPRGSWIAENGTTACPGNKTGYMCWCGFRSSTDNIMIGKYNKVDTCKDVGAVSYPMSDIDDDVFIVGTSCWKNDVYGIEIFYGMSGVVKKSYYGKGFSIHNDRIKSVIAVDGEIREYMSDITTEEINAGEDIVLFYTNDHEKSITVKFSGYIDSGMKIPLMLGQAAIWR